MIGGIIGDIIGSVYESVNIKSTDFPFWRDDVGYTDDSLMTIATARWLLLGGNVADHYIHIAQNHSCMRGGYGGQFSSWLYNAVRNGCKYPYNSCGNGSAMRVGPVGWSCDTEELVLEKAKESAICTHNHPEGIKGAQAIAIAVYWARHQFSQSSIQRKIEELFDYELNFSLDELREEYGWRSKRWPYGELCQGSVPQAIRCFLDSNSFEEAIRNAVSIGGDSDTIACMTGSIAEAFWGVPIDLRNKALTFLDGELKDIVIDFENNFGNYIIR